MRTPRYNVAGARIPPEVLDVLLERMRAGPFTAREIERLALKTLPAHGVPRVLAYPLAHRLVSEQMRDGRLSSSRDPSLTRNRKRYTPR